MKFDNNNFGNVYDSRAETFNLVVLQLKIILPTTILHCCFLVEPACVRNVLLNWEVGLKVTVE